MNNNNQPSSITSSLNQLKLGNLPQLKLSKSVKTSILSSQIVEFIVLEIKLIPNFDLMARDLNLAHHICMMIENLERRDLEPKLDKKALFLEIIKQLFPDLTVVELSFLDNFVDYICASNLVNKVSTLSKFVSSVKKNLH